MVHRLFNSFNNARRVQTGTWHAIEECAQMASLNPRLPPKRWVAPTLFNDANVEQRRQGLHAFLEALLRDPDLAFCAEVRRRKVLRRRCPIRLLP